MGGGENNALVFGEAVTYQLACNYGMRRSCGEGGGRREVRLLERGDAGLGRVAVYRDSWVGLGGKGGGMRPPGFTMCRWE